MQAGREALVEVGTVEMPPDSSVGQHSASQTACRHSEAGRQQDVESHLKVDSQVNLRWIRSERFF